MLGDAPDETREPYRTSVPHWLRLLHHRRDSLLAPSGLAP